MTLTQRHKMLAALLLYSSLFSISHLSAADLPVVRASYNAIGGVFTPLWLAQENKLFNKYGISVDLKFLPLTTGTQALLTKNVDIITPGGELLRLGSTAKELSTSPASRTRWCFQSLPSRRFNRWPICAAKLFRRWLPAPSAIIWRGFFFRKPAWCRAGC